MPKVDAKGRVVLPQAIRERLDIAPGTEVQVREEDGEVVIRPEDDPDRIVERLERLVEETASRPEATAPLHGEDDGSDPDPIAQRHRDAVRRGVAGAGETTETGETAETPEAESGNDSEERDGTDE